MKLFLRDEVFAHARTELLGFFQSAMDDRYFVEIDESGPSYQAWFANRSNQDREYILTAIAVSSHSSSLASIDIAAIGVSDWKNNVLSIRDGLDFVRLPYRIVVENSINDRRFLLAIATIQQRDVLKKAEEAHNIDFVLGGGINEILNQLRSDENNDLGKLRRTFVVVDGDALWRGKPSDVATDIRELCRRNHVPCHVLRRRSAENYLTIEALRAHAQYPGRLQNIYQAFVNLRVPLRHHYHMKKGLRKDHGCAFLTLGSADIDALRLGWGTDIGKLFDNVREHDLLRGGAMRELGPMMRKLIAHIR